VKLLETERLTLREMDSAIDAEFIFELLNTPKFIKYIGDREVRSVQQAVVFIEDRYRQSYRDHGFGLYVVELHNSAFVEDTLPTGRVSALYTGMPIGVCGFVRRESLPGPDIGFAFLPEFEGKGYGFESAAAVMQYGRDVLGFSRVLAITSLDNDVSGKLLEKLGFTFNRIFTNPDGEDLKLFETQF
jgi:[ribosomal protein S5]-alanine N-acetyltransferase